MAIEPKTKMDQDKLTESLNRLAEEDPTFRVDYDEDSGQTIISGMGELHLEVVVDRLLREFQVDANVGKPQVAYRETIKRPGQGCAWKVRQADRRPRPVRRRRASTSSRSSAGPGYEFESKIHGGEVPREYIPAVDRGIQEAASTAAWSRAIRWSTSRRSWWTGRSTRSTLPSSRSRSPRRWR